MEITWLVLTCILVTLITLLYFWFKQYKNYWHRRGVPNESNSIYFAPSQDHVAFYLQKVYNKYLTSNTSFVGMFLGFQLGVLLLDLDLIKRVFISDFESFPDRGFYHNLRDDPLSGNLLRLEAGQWRRLRTKLTPTFTSGKMRFMFPTVVDVANRFAEVMLEMVNTSANVLSGKTGSGIELQIRDICACFTTDVIGSVAFGIECNSLREPNSEFRLKGDKAFQCFNPIRETFGTRYLKLFNRLHIKAFTQELIDFYTKVVKQNIEYREANKIRRNDFLDILMEMRQENVEPGDFTLTLNEIVAQVFVFFIGGFETSSSTMSFCLYELVCNPEIQERTRANILETLRKHDQKLSYDCLKDMRYLEQVVLETLRKYPIAPTLKRVARKHYDIPNTPHCIEPGVQAIIPVFAIHHNPEYYQEPHKFDPDRFCPDEVAKRHPMTYLPFGAGPRGCIAERFGKMQTMIGLASLLKNFRFSKCERTASKLEYNWRNIRIFEVKGGIWLKVEQL